MATFLKIAFPYSKNIGQGMVQIISLTKSQLKFSGKVGSLWKMDD